MSKQPKQFRNRILEYGEKPADQFLAHPKNARMHPQFQREAMKAALDTVGFVAPVLEAASGYLVDGHERIWQALQNDNAMVPYVKLDISEEEEAYVLATFDPLTALANYDAELLDGLLQEVNSDSPAIQRMLAELSGVAANDPYAEWVGMPEFEQDNINPYHTMQIHFMNADAIGEFSKLIDQIVTDKTRFIYYPKQEKLNLKPYRVVDES